jgi:site-specific DNA-methyltransferase (adenine-specific)
MELNKIYCADNLDFLQELAKSEVKVDLVLTDPPYNIGKDFGNDSRQRAAADVPRVG